MITVRRTKGAALAAMAVLALGVGAPSALAASGQTHHQTATAIAKAKKAKNLARKAAQARRTAALAKQTAAARYLGVTGSQLATALASGQSLADLAADNGKTATGLVQAILASAKTYLTSAVAGGDLTQAQADAILSGLTRSVTADVNRSTSPRPLPQPGFGFGHGPGGANLSAAAATYIGVTQDALRTALQGGSSLAKVATDNGKTVDGLIQALVAAAKTDIAQAVTDGDLTQAQADQILADLTQRITDQVNRAGLPGRPGPPPGFGFGHGPGGANLSAAAATYIGVTQDALRTALQGGSSLAKVATDNGKTVDGLIQALVAAAKTDIAQAVTDGDLTQAQADQILADLTQRITDQANRAGGDCGPGGPRGGGPRGAGPGAGFFGGPADSGGAGIAF